MRAGGDGLCGGAGKPVDNCAAGDQSQHEGRVQQRQTFRVSGQSVGQRHNNREDHGGCADDRRADENGFSRRLERVAGAVVFFQQVLGALEHHGHVVIAFEFFDDVRLMLDQ